jgi:hypothetical protein
MIRKQIGKDVADHFLGQGQKKADPSYLFRDQEVVHQAVVWVAEEYGIKRFHYP